MKKISSPNNRSRKKLYLGQNRHTASSLGADFFPILSVKKMSASSPKIRHLFKSIPSSTHVLITSPSSAKIFAKTALSFGYRRHLKKLHYLSIGHVTSQTLRTYISPSLSIEESEAPLAESLALLIPSLPSDSMVLYPSSSLARNLLLNTLISNKTLHKHCFLYRMIPNKLPQHYLNHYEEFLFTSPSGVRAYAKQHPFMEKKSYSCIGEITAQELLKYCSKVSFFN
ncbi:uroporphyrinogen-III synthase [Chlamydiifrater phoenicopteri]|uniref:uroporphyrinogen-III synthase n=1 Tax=Chlamydiifrater phoenicopteri TaxID=2681469 RepID=UPI001BCEA2FF|nr:uroporphyrinogen-III synthase [Chlamydiifrater phoenicopteri]